MLAVGFVVGISISVAYAVIADDLICDGCVNSSDIKNKNVKKADIKNNAVTSVKIRDGSITSADLGTLTDLNISGNIVSSGDICIGSCP